MKRLIVVFAICGLLLSALSATNAEATETISFTAAYVKTVLAGYGAFLDTTSYYYGLTDIRVMPVLTSGTFTLVSGSGLTNATDWVAQVPGTYPEDMGPYVAGKFVQFHSAAAPDYYGDYVYLITSLAASNFGPVPGYAGKNVVVKTVNDASSFSFDFNVTGGTWNGAYQFLVDGVKFNATTGQYISTFVGGSAGFSLPGNSIDEGHFGYQVAGSTVPLPSTLLLLGSGLVGLLVFGRRRWSSR